MVDMFTLLCCILCSVIGNPKTVDLSQVRRSMKIFLFYCVMGHCRFYAWPGILSHMGDTRVAFVAQGNSRK